MVQTQISSIADVYLERHQLALLVAVARHESITAAAVAENITQSAASQRLREAERRLGVTLTNRRGRSVVLTSAARHLIQAAERAEQLLSAAEAEARWIDRATTTSARLRVAVTVFDVVPWLVPLSRHLRERGAALELVRASPPTIGTILTDGSADVSLMPTLHVPAGCETVPWFDDVLVAVVASEDVLAERLSVAPHDLADRTYVTYSELPERGFEYEQFFAPAGAFPARVDRVESTSSTVRLVAGGAGVTILPSAESDGAGLWPVATVPLSSPTSVEWSIAIAPNSEAQDKVTDLLLPWTTTFRPANASET